MAVRFLIIGGGPAGNTAATFAARLGADVVMVEREIVGGAAHLLDCIPSGLHSFEDHDCDWWGNDFRAQISRYGP